MPDQTLAQRIKAKYPEYNDMPDADLEQKVLAKYPEYGDLPRTQAAPPPNAKTTLERMRSGMSFKEAMDPYIGFGKDIAGTAANAASLINKIPGVGETLAPSQGVQAFQQAVAPTNTAQKVGAVASSIGQLAIPVGGEGKAAKAVVETLPSAERAMQGFESVAQVANKMPVKLTNATPGLNELLNWQRTTNLGPTVNKFVARVTNPKMGELTYEEARRFYQIFGKMSVDESLKMPEAAKAAINQMRVGLKTDIGNAAALADKSTQYYNAMKEFSGAKRLEDISDATKGVLMDLLKKSIQGTVLGSGFVAGKKLFDELY
jgi:hypothetical protein